MRCDHGTDHMPEHGITTPPALQHSKPGLPLPYVVSSPYGGSAEPYYAQRGSAECSERIIRPSCCQVFVGQEVFVNHHLVWLYG